MNEQETTKLWEDYQNGLMYQASIKLSQNVPKFVKFYEGDQWAKSTDKTKNLPRPVFNMVKMICRNKKSAILSTPVKLVFRSEDGLGDIEKFNRFAEYIVKELEQDRLDADAIDDGVITGSYFYHYYWDAEAKGKNGVEEGGLRCEIIDPLNIFFSNPTCEDEQKQKWIIIASREEVDAVKAKCDKDVDKDLIISDSSDDKYATVEQEGTKLVTVLTRYFRKNGEVYCERGTKSVITNKPFPLTPDLVEAEKDLGFVEEDAPNMPLPDNKEDGENLIPQGTKAYLYPIVKGNYERRKKCIYGLGEVEGIIPNQKAVNFGYAMMLLTMQETAWGKYVVDPKALREQTITNTPGQVLTDYTGTMNGIKKLSEQSIPTAPLNIVEAIMSSTRAVTGSTEVMTGETIGANMSGAAIAQLQAQASQPIEELRDNFWRVKEKQGKVLIQFFKLYYREKEFTYREERIVGGRRQEELMNDVFSSVDYENNDISVVVEATSGTKASAAGDIATLDNLLQRNLINIRTYIKAYPNDALSNKTELLNGIDEAEQSEMAMMQAQAQQLAKQLEQSQAVIKQYQSTVENVMSVIRENNALKSELADLYAEATSKINQANQMIEMGNQGLAQTTEDAKMFASALNERMQPTKGA